MNKHESDSKPRKRARGMNVEERRAMIVQTALKLLSEEGPNVTTLQIAKAAGISEPTIFRAFADKREVLAACLEEVTNPEHIAIEMEAIDEKAGLEERLSKLIEVLQTHSEKSWAVLNAIRLAATAKPRTPSPQEDGGIRKSWMQRQAKAHAEVCKVLLPYESELRLPVPALATIIMSSVFSLGQAGAWRGGVAGITTAQLAELILHGVLK